MIYGIGCDIVQVSRFSKLVSDSTFLQRFFNQKEMAEGKMTAQRLSEHYAVRFAVKEAFSKALGTGISGFELKDAYVMKTNPHGKPELFLEESAKKLLENVCGSKSKIHISLSHEKEYAIAYVVIEVE